CLFRVFKKTSGNGHIALYLGKRDFVDNVDSVEVVDGVVKVDPSGLNGRNVYVYLACAFRYGSDDLDVIGLSFRRDIWIKRIQVYPPTGETPTKTPMLESLMKKVGDQGAPFSFQMPTNLPCSVSLQPGSNDSGKACGVDFEVKAYIANNKDSADEVIDKKDTCRLIIRKIQFAPATNNPGPKAEVSKQFMMTDKPVHLEASLEKEIYYHGDPIKMNVKINNETNKTVKKIKVSVEQVTNVALYSSDTYAKDVFTAEYGETVNANSTFDKTYDFTPLLSNNKEKRGISVDGRLKDEDTCLSLRVAVMQLRIVSSTYGILKQIRTYESDVTVELPLTLMCPKPAGECNVSRNCARNVSCDFSLFLVHDR
uniref:Arrestin-C n=1 Tax=Salarias fasciatus TaxID=181472 RepID=A0A672IDZ4_SALFA